MKAVLMRVRRASITIDERETRSIGRGFLILLAVTHDDTEAQAVKLADKLCSLRLFEDAGGKINLTLDEVGGEIMIVSQFTLYGNCRKGRRPEFLNAARPETAIPLYENSSPSSAPRAITLRPANSAPTWRSIPSTTAPSPSSWTRRIWKPPSNRTEVSFMKVITTVVGELGTNCYLLIDEATREAALIDPADSPDELSALIEREGVTLRYILLTHGHRDHTLAAPAMHKRYPAAAVYIHRLDANGSGIYHYPLEGVIDGLNYYDEGDTLPLGSLTISVLYTPGHTAGSITLKVGDALFVGDTLFAGSCGRTDLPGGDPMEMLASLRRLGRLEGDYTVYPGHMDSTTLAREKQYNPFIRQALR